MKGLIMQKFNKYDYIRIVKDLGCFMSHFQGDCDAIIIGSYADQFGGKDIKSYTVYLKGQGQVSWYREHQLILIEKNRKDIYDKWEAERQKEIEQKSDINWIFANGKEVINNGYGASVITLAKYLNIVNLWGEHGEYFTYSENATLLLEMAKFFLLTNDKIGWLKFCEKARNDRKN